MKIINFLFLSFIFLFGSLTYASDVSNEWVDDWVTAVKFSKNQKTYLESAKAYTTALNHLEKDQISNHRYLYNERGRIYLQLQDFSHAIQDFTFVLQDKQAHQEEIIDALWGRGQAYLASGRNQEFEKDRKRLDEIEPFATPIEEHPNYLLLKLGNHVWRDAKSRERFIKALLMQKKIKSTQDVTFTPSGIVIIKK